MTTFFRALMGGISLVFLYALIVLITLFIIRLSGITHIESSPKILNLPLYVIKIEGSKFVAEATWLGLILSLVAGTAFYYLVHFFTRNRSR